MRRLENPAAVERFRSAILSKLGLQFDDSRLGFLAEVIQLRLDDTRMAADVYLDALENGYFHTELAPLAKELTVPETYFFRNSEQFRVFREVVVPARMRAQVLTRRLSVLSAGCASGEEPYSLAMTMFDVLPDPSWSVGIRALDINPVALKKARQARYSTWAFRETPPQVQARWFKPDGRDFILNDGVRNAVTFEECNLAAENSDVWRPHSYDAIFCRNVLMYFSPEQARKVMSRMSRALVPGGFLFLGHAETMRGLSDDFHLRHTHGAFYYERKLDAEIAASAATSDARSHLSPDETLALADDWIGAIRRASEHVNSLKSASDPRTPVSRKTARPTARNTPLDMAPVFALLHGDRFAEALAYVRELPKEAGEDADALLLEAMLLAHGGETGEAERVCHRLLQIDEFNASAHHVLALCREAAGDLEAAMEQDRIAAYLDPTFAMPHLHMGLLARRAGNRESARRELGVALPLLRHEDSARLMLFAGGFNRQSMIDLCASAFKDCGGAL
jgi:chemotaxis protein methyltransferase CheR